MEITELPFITFAIGLLSFIFVNPYLAILTVVLGIVSLIRIHKLKKKGKHYAWTGMAIAIFPYFGLTIILLSALYWLPDRSFF